MFEYNLSPRKNSIHKWAPIDAEESYSARQPDGSPNYSTVDIEYSYNSDGFRCDEFSNMSDLPITFVGCNRRYWTTVEPLLAEVFDRHN